MSPHLTEFIDALDQFVEDAAVGRLTHGQRLKLLLYFDREFGAAVAAERRDLLALLVVREVCKQWQPEWYDEGVFIAENEAREPVREFPDIFLRPLAPLLDPNSPERAILSGWFNSVLKWFDDFSFDLHPRGGLIVGTCAALRWRFGRWDEEVCADVCGSRQWNSPEAIDASYHFESDCGPRFVEDGWERLCEHDWYAKQVSLAPDRRRAWHWWLEQVRLVADHPEDVRIRLGTFE